MATTITMPQLGETVTEGTVAQWLKSIGDSVDKYEDFVEVSTDKVNAGVPSPVTGTIRELLVKEGETVATGTPIAVIDEVGAVRAEVPQAPAVAPCRARPAALAERRKVWNGRERRGGGRRARCVAGGPATRARASRRHSNDQG